MKHIFSRQDTIFVNDMILNFIISSSEMKPHWLKSSHMTGIISAILM